MAVRRIAFLFAVAISLIAAPCRNCFAAPTGTPFGATQTGGGEAGHDCCPKPKPAEPCHGQPEGGCAWSPADPGLTVDKQSAAPPDAQAVSLMPVELSAAPRRIAPLPALLVPSAPSPPSLLSTVNRR